MAAHGFVFTISPFPLPVFITLVGGDIDDRTKVWTAPRSFQHVNGTHDIGGIGFNRFAIGQANQRLRCHMYQNIRAETGYGLGNDLQVADVADRRLHAVADSSLIK
ncbi:hypothetical protein CF161_15677 [Pseudomonas sp. CF161]|nr:hypothetical protein CF161_15677 [Pseudomonas sp. CF161]